ncbi:MAG TPA: DUF1501 domain-containing protein [Anaerolineae bacterium]|nr:DUF1501 domain-containing protein [Anaerolineae bacterium]
MSITNNNPVLTTGHCTEYAHFNRRQFLHNSMQAAASLVLGNSLVALPTWMPRIKLAAPHVGPRGDTLVCIFLRGGADGLNIIVPHADDHYYQRRPTIAIPRPDDNRAEATAKAIDLDGFFGLHPALAPLHELYTAGDLALIHAVGSPDESRSHFEAMALMERGIEEGNEYTGWLARHLATLDTNNESALRAISVGDMLPASLTGAVNATALESIGDFHLAGEASRAAEMQKLLHILYGQDDNILTHAAQQTLAAMELIAGIGITADPPPQRNGRDNQDFSQRPFARALHTVTQLLHADIGLEVACIDFGGWDTHIGQGGSDGQMARLIAELGQGLATFYHSITKHRNNVTIVVMSEFGRRVKENGGLGTDHGHGNMMMVLGGGINGGQTISQWPGLAPEQLVGPGDLAVTIDYRDILAEIIQKRLNNPLITNIFPDYTVQTRNLAQLR